MKETKRPVVSLLMPVYNSFSFARSNGKSLLPLALKSLLRQTHQDFELIILDNQSTDDTAEMCQRFAEQDVRVKYVLDAQERFVEEAITRLGELAQGRYCMIVNDDDLWQHDYLEKLFVYAESHPNTDLVYGCMLMIDPKNHITNAIYPKTDEIYNENMSRLFSFIRYIKKRNVLPINFGLFRTKAFREVLPYEDFDTLKENVDNVFMSKFFLSDLKAHYLDDTFFCYRNKVRRFGKSAFDMPDLDKPLVVWLFYVRHQMLFFKKLKDLVHKSAFSEDKFEFLGSVLLIYCIQASFEILGWLESEMRIQCKYKEATVLMYLLTKYRGGSMAKELDCPDAEFFIKKYTREDLIDGAVGWWSIKAKRVVENFLNFLHDINEICDDETTMLQFQIKNILEPEVEYYNELTLNSNLKLIENNIPKELLYRKRSFFTKKNMAKIFPSVFSLLKEIKMVWCRARFYSIIRYIFE